MILNRIRLLRQKNNLKQEELCKIINVSQASLSGYENGKFEPDSDTLLRLAAYFNVSVDYVLGYDRANQNVAISSRIPVLQRCMTEQEMSQVSFLKHVEISEEMAMLGEHFALEMQDSSMEPRIQRGDIIIFRKQAEVKNGAICAVVIENNRTIVTRLLKLEKGLILIPLNINYAAQTFTAEEIKRLPVAIAGQAVELRGKC